MTGQDVDTALEIKLGEYSLGYFDNARKNSFLKNAVVDKVDKKIEEFQKTQKVTREMQPLITKLNALSPVSSTIDISQTSSLVPDYYQLISIDCYSPYKGTTIKKTAKLRRADQTIDPFSIGIERYPKYTMTDGLIELEPATISSVDIVYFKTPFYIDVADNSTQIPYNDKFIQLLIDTAIQYMGDEQRDDFSINSSLQNQQLNP